MRISDWSSDVCSSDLEGLAHLFYVRKSRAYLVSCKLLIVTGLKIVQIVRHGRTEATTAEPASHQPDPRADGRFLVAAGARHLQDEIGSGSSRERVCMDGEISVAAVYVKKKKKN